MVNVPSRGRFDTTSEWIEAVAEETRVEAEVLESVVEEVDRGTTGSPSSEKQSQLRRLLESHTDFMTEREGEARAWIDVYFERDGEVDSYYQYSMMNHNLAEAKEEEVASLKAVADEEDMEVERRENSATAAQYDWEGVDEELRRLLKVLDEVYGVGFEDIVHAEEAREGEYIGWGQA